ncbi:MAG TPA: hypothetical protein VGV35_12320, partial [Bryobacteraceae bacterium]|nr:hypothetical protein [Bryobacteraceae bacterium]
LAGIPATAPLTVAGTSSNDTVYVKQIGTTLGEWINAAQPGQGTPTHTHEMGSVSSLTLQGAGGNDRIIIDETGADLLATPTTAASTGGAVSLELIGSPNPDTVFIHGDTSRIAFNSDALIFSNVTALTFWDTAGSDSVEVAAASIPTTLDLTDNDNIAIDSGNVTLNIQPAGTQPTFTASTTTGSSTSGVTTGDSGTTSGGTTRITGKRKHHHSSKHGAAIFSECRRAFIRRFGVIGFDVGRVSTPPFRLV